MLIRPTGHLRPPSAPEGLSAQGRSASTSGSPSRASAASSAPVCAACCTNSTTRLGWWQRLGDRGARRRSRSGCDRQRQPARRSASPACCTRSCRSGSTSRPAGPACSTSATSRSSASARTGTRSSPRPRSVPAARAEPIWRRSCRSRSCWSPAAWSACSIGLIALRLEGDYLAIVTLFVGQAFVEFVNNVDPGTLGGVNGLFGLDSLHGLSGTSRPRAASTIVALIVRRRLSRALHLLDTSRTGRAWRALRDDPLAAAR